MIVVDSPVWIDAFNGRHTRQTEWLKVNLGGGRIALTDLILCEVLRGFDLDSAYTGIKNELLRFEVYSTGGPDLAIAATEHYRILRKRGITVRKVMDCFVATYCIREKHALLHNDRDFDPFEEHLGLKVVHP